MGVNPQYSLLRRRHGGPGQDLSPCQLLRIDGHRAARYRLGSCKRLSGDGGHAAANVAVHVRNVVDGCIVSDDRRVVDVGNCCLIDRGVRDVYSIHVCRTYVIGRNVDFARTEREPGDGRTNGNAASDERDQGRRVHRTVLTGAGYPPPAPIEARPAAVVERRISPWVVVNPSPSPRIDPRPMSVMIRGPANVHTGKPNGAIVWIRPPVPVLVEILESHGAARAITSRSGSLVPGLALSAPVVEIVGSTDLIHFGVERRSSVQCETLAGMHRVALPVARGLALTLADRDDGVVAIFRGVDAITSRLERRERLVGCIDFENVVAIQIPEANVEAAGTKLNLNRAVIEIEKRESSVGGEVESRRTQLHFGARVAIRP